MSPRPAPRRILAALAVLLLIVACIPTVSADEILYDEDLVSIIDTSISGEYNSGLAPVGNNYFYKISLADITLYPELSYIAIEVPLNGGLDKHSSGAIYLDQGDHEFTYTLNGEKTGHVYISRSTDIFGTVTSTRMIIFFDDWDIGELTGRQTIPLSFGLFHGSNPSSKGFNPADCPISLRNENDYGVSSDITVKYNIAAAIPWKNHITVIKNDAPVGYEITLTRTIDGDLYTSTINCSLNNDVVFSNSGHGTLFSGYYPLGEVDKITVLNPSDYLFTYSLLEDVPNATATVYVRSTQTGALISGAHIVIDGTPTTSDWVEYVNETLSSGMSSYSLPGMPYQYRIVATADGYTYPAAMQYFRAGDTVVCEMTPTLDAPVNESNTFLEFYVRDTNANPLPGATVEVNDEWAYTNNNGYKRFEVPKNATYLYNVQKSGYMTISGTATVADAGSYTVNVVLGAGTVPTYSPTPTEPGATPTPDTRTNEEKGQAVIDMIADNAEGLGALGLICLIMGLLKLIAKW